MLRGQALAALAEAGTAARPVLERLAGSEAPLTRARALRQLAQLGDATAREALGGFAGASDPELQAAALLALDPDQDAPALRAALDSPQAAMREAALQRLARAQPDPATRDALEHTARFDPEESLRLRALSALAHQGPAAFVTLERLLVDPSAAVRAQTASLLPAVDYARAEPRLTQLIAGAVSDEAIAAASALIAQLRGDAPPAARALLTRALESPDTALRGRAAVALMSLRDPALEVVAAARAPREAARNVKLCLAVGMAPFRKERGELLRGLLTANDPTAVSAASELARGGDEKGLEFLQLRLQDKDAKMRRAVVRALGGELERTYEVRGALRDPDAGVRMAAASAILRRG